MAVPNPAIGDFIRIKATASVGGQTAVWGGDFRVAAIGGAGLTLKQIADRTGVKFDAEIPATLANPATVGHPIVELVSPLSGQVLQSALGASTLPSGTGGADMLPRQVAAVVQKVTGLAGPKFRGRAYWPFLPVGFIDADSQLTNIARATLDVAAIEVLDTQIPTVGADSVTLTPVIFHRFPGPVPSYTDVISVATSTKLGTQRRRGDYGRPNTPV